MITYSERDRLRQGIGMGQLLRFPNASLREAATFHGLREDVRESAQRCENLGAELRLTIMETRIRLAELRATLRQTSSSEVELAKLETPTACPEL